MGKKGSSKKPPQITPNPTHRPLSLRQESIGKTQTKGASRNPKSFLKLEHLQNLAVWASGEASIPSLAAFFGRQYASAGETLAVPPDPSLISCQRCETILQPGFTCTVRLERTRTKPRGRHKKPNITLQNNVVFKCNFCSHRNLKRGTPKGHMKEICPSKPQPSAKSASLERVTISKDETDKADEIALPLIFGDTSISNSPATPAIRSGATLLDAKRRKRNRSGPKKLGESESKNVAEDTEKTVGVSNKRKRKSWASLKEIAESSEHDNTQNIANLIIPFII